MPRCNYFLREEKKSETDEAVSCRRNSLCDSLGFSLHEANNFIVRGGAVAHLFLAQETLVYDHPPLLGMLVDPDRLHEAQAERCTVSRARFIDMFGVQALGAVIAVAAVDQKIHRSAAVFTDKDFLPRYECHTCTLISQNLSLQ